MRKILFSVLILFCAATTVWSQSREIEDLVRRGEGLFKVNNYDRALEQLQKAIELGANDPMVHYMTGVSYIKQSNSSQQIKSVSHFEKAVGTANVPKDVYYYIGEAYHKNLQLEKAINNLDKYRSGLSANDKEELKKVDELLKQCNNAVVLMSNKKDIDIVRMAPPINSEFTEYNPVVSADQSIMAFTSLRPDKRTGRAMEEIYITTSSATGNWTEPRKIDIKTQYNVGTAGISPDGQQMIIFIGGDRGSGNLYSMNREGQGWGSPSSMGNSINSNYLETTASITPDGKRIYFASNRPGGYGGLDIYVSEKKADGTWSAPQNMGPAINTPYDEDAPFIHPDQKTLFFTSNGHNTIGGRDIFKSVLVGGKWQEPENMGYPINTPLDDNYFTLTADGSKGFFSSDRPGGYGGQDIYTFDMPEQYSNIPLTMIKGRILTGENEEVVPTKIKVVDNENNTKVDYVYNPDPVTGNYLVILPPGKNYDLIIESEGYLPYTLNINIPNQTSFYELYQKVVLKLIKQFDVIVGQEVEVSNAFYDLQMSEQMTPRKANEAMLIKSDSLDMYDLMDAIISSEDTAAFEYLLDLMYATNPIDNVEFDENNDDLEKAKRTYFYDESDTTTLQSRVVDGETIFSLPTFYVTEEAKKQKEEKAKGKDRVIKYDKSLLSNVTKVYFDVGKSNMEAKYEKDLENLLQNLKKYPDLGIEISGFASPEGNEELNRQLSNARAIEVLNYFNFKGIVRRRIVAKGYGSQGAKETNANEARRVEIRLIDLMEEN